MISPKGDCFPIRKVNKNLKKVKQFKSTKSLLRRFDTLPRCNETTDRNKPKERSQIEKEKREQRGKGEKIKFKNKRERRERTLILCCTLRFPK